MHLNQTIDQDITITCSPNQADADFCGDNALPQALASLDGRHITGSVIIALQDGVYGAGSPLPEIPITHPDADRIHIQGPMEDAEAFSMSAPPDPVAKTFTLDNRNGVFHAFDFAPGGERRPYIIYIIGSEGNDGPYTVISAEDANGPEGAGHIVLTVRETIYSAAMGGMVYLPPANRCQLVFAPNVNGISKREDGVCQLSGLRLIGNTYGNHGGLLAFSGAEWQTQGTIVEGFRIQYWAAYGGRIIHQEQYGCYARPNVALGGAAGFHSYHHSEIHAPCCLAGWGRTGFSADTFSSVYARASIAAGFGDVGFKAAMHGLLFAHQAIAHNNAAGCRAVNQGTIFRESLRTAGNGIDYDPNGRPPQHSLTGGWMV